MSDAKYKCVCGSIIATNTPSKIKLHENSKKHIAFINGTNVERKQRKIKYEQTYYERHRDEQLQKAKEYNKKNKEKQQKYQSNYYKKNKEKIMKKRNENQQNYTFTNNFVLCECGLYYRKYEFKKHFNSIMHNKYLNNNDFDDTYIKCDCNKYIKTFSIHSHKNTNYHISVMEHINKNKTNVINKLHSF